MIPYKKSLSSVALVCISRMVYFGEFSVELHYHCYRWFIKMLFWWRAPGYVCLKHFQAIKIWGLLGYLGS